jgi:hypothetical protein
MGVKGYVICPIIEINVLVKICNRYIIDCSFLGIVSFFLLACDVEIECYVTSFLDSHAKP